MTTEGLVCDASSRRQYNFFRVSDLLIEEITTLLAGNTTQEGKEKEEAIRKKYGIHGDISKIYMAPTIDIKGVADAYTGYSIFNGRMSYSQKTNELQYLYEDV